MDEQQPPIESPTGGAATTKPSRRRQGVVVIPRVGNDKAARLIVAQGRVWQPDACAQDSAMRWQSLTAAQGAALRRSLSRGLRRFLLRNKPVPRTVQVSIELRVTVCRAHVAVRANDDCIVERVEGIGGSLSGLLRSSSTATSDTPPPPLTFKHRVEWAVKGPKRRRSHFVEFDTRDLQGQALVPNSSRLVVAEACITTAIYVLTNHPHDLRVDFIARLVKTVVDPTRVLASLNIVKSLCATPITEKTALGTECRAVRTEEVKTARVLATEGQLLSLTGTTRTWKASPVAAKPLPSSSDGTTATAAADADEGEVNYGVDLGSSDHQDEKAVLPSSDATSLQSVEWSCDTPITWAEELKSSELEHLGRSLSRFVMAKLGSKQHRDAASLKTAAATATRKKKDLGEALLAVANSFAAVAPGLETLGPAPATPTVVLSSDRHLACAALSYVASADVSPHQVELFHHDSSLIIPGPLGTLLMEAAHMSGLQDRRRLAQSATTWLPQVAARLKLLSQDLVLGHDPSDLHEAFHRHDVPPRVLEALFDGGQRGMSLAFPRRRCYPFIHVAGKTQQQNYFVAVRLPCKVGEAPFNSTALVAPFGAATLREAEEEWGDVPTVMCFQSTSLVVVLNEPRARFALEVAKTSHINRAERVAVKSLHQMNLAAAEGNTITNRGLLRSPVALGEPVFLGARLVGFGVGKSVSLLHEGLTTGVFRRVALRRR